MVFICWFVLFPPKNALFNRNFLLKFRKLPVLGVLLIWGGDCFVCFTENLWSLKMKKVMLSFCIFFIVVNTTMNLFLIQNSIKRYTIAKFL